VNGDMTGAGTVTIEAINADDLTSLVSVGAIEIANAAAVTMTIAQHLLISAAAGTETVTLSAAGTVVGNSTIEIYNLAAGDNTFTTDAVGQTVVGNTGNDVITGLGGNDTISGGAGGDYIDAGAGDDIINAGAGSDVVFGGDGSDVFRIASADITTGIDIDTVNLFGDFTTGEDTVDLSGFVFKNLAGTTFTSAYGSDVVTTDAVTLSAASATNANVIYTVTSTASNFNTQTSVDTAVTEIIADASTLVFAAGKLASVLIQVVGSDGNDVALFHYTEAGSNGIQEAELDLLGVFVSADTLVAADIIL